MTRRPSLWVRLVASAAVVVAAAACGYVPNSPSVPLTKTDIQIGTGTEAATGRTVIVHLAGWIHNPDRPDGKGVQFTTTGSSPIFFVIGGADVIAGINLGMLGMRVGGIRRILVPSTLAFGATGSGVIPPFSNLIFEVELLEVL